MEGKSKTDPRLWRKGLVPTLGLIFSSPYETGRGFLLLTRAAPIKGRPP